MKFIVLTLCLLSMGKAFGQHQHMIEMSTNSTSLGALSFTDDGNDTDKTFFVSGNYAYKISERIQLGIQGFYSHVDTSSNVESYGLDLGAIYNFDDDFTNAFYLSLYGGLTWSHRGGSGDSETWNGRTAIGKRFALSKINLPNVTYSPEISYTRAESTYSGHGVNAVTISFLQFAVFF